MGETKRFDIESCEVQENGEIICEEIVEPSNTDFSIAKKEEVPDLKGSIPKKPERPPENIELT